MAANVRSRKGRIQASHRGSKKDVRRNIVTARFSDDEYALVCTMAQHVGLSPAAFVATVVVAEAFGLFGRVESNGEVVRRSGGLPTDPSEAGEVFAMLYTRRVEGGAL